MNLDLDLSDVGRRTALAESICALLRNDPHILSITYYGSLATGQADAYSDIDIRLDLTKTTDRAFAEALPEIVRPIGDLLLADWSLGALPDLFARTFYFVDYPLFWHVDIACHSEQHVDGTDLKQMYHPAQIFKIWIDSVSDTLRGKDTTAHLEQIMRHWADLSPFEKASPAQKLSHYLDLCIERARSRNAQIEPLIARCDALRLDGLK